MKTLINRFPAIIGIVLLLSVMFIPTSCKKDKTCHGKVKVVDTNGAPVSGASVHLAAPSVNGDVVYDNTTDGSGEASFDVKLPAIFDVTATSPLYSTTAVGVLRLDEPGKDADVTIKFP